MGVDLVLIILNVGLGLVTGKTEDKGKGPMFLISKVSCCVGVCGKLWNWLNRIPHGSIVL